MWRNPVLVEKSPIKMRKDIFVVNPLFHALQMLIQSLVRKEEYWEEADVPQDGLDKMSFILLIYIFKKVPLYISCYLFKFKLFKRFVLLNGSPSYKVCSLSSPPGSWPWLVFGHQWCNHWGEPLHRKSPDHQVWSCGQVAILYQEDRQKWSWN